LDGEEDDDMHGGIMPFEDIDDHPTVVQKVIFVLLLYLVVRMITCTVLPRTYSKAVDVGLHI